jgi:hypothetical protein
MQLPQRIEVETPVSEGTLDAGARERLRKDLLRSRCSGTHYRGGSPGHLGMTRIAFMELARQRGVPSAARHCGRLFPDTPLVNPHGEGHAGRRRATLSGGAAPPLQKERGVSVLRTRNCSSALETDETLRSIWSQRRITTAGIRAIRLFDLQGRFPDGRSSVSPEILLQRLSYL